MTPEVEAKIRDSFARQTMMETLGASLSELAPGHVVITAPVAPHLQQQHGYAHAGLTFAIGDSAAGYAALSLMPEEAEVNTIEMKINLLRPGAGDRLIATGRVIRPGRRVFAVEASVMVEKEGATTEIARLIGTMIPL